MTKPKRLPPLELLNELFLIDGGTLVRRNSTRRIGCLHKGYLRTAIDGSLYKVHRIIWALANGQDPGDLEIDHRDGDKLNNHPSNLRLATRSQNQSNKPAKGYYWHKQKRKWHAYVTAARKRHHIGYFQTEEQARAAYLEAIAQLHGGFACDRAA